MSGVDACVGLLEIPVCCVLKENDQRLRLMVTLFLCWFWFVLLRFASCIFSVPGKLAVDETSNHCITTVTKMHVN